jgi:hypothetical protein
MKFAGIFVLICVLGLVSPVFSNEDKSNAINPGFSVSVNTMGLFLGTYGGAVEFKIIDRLSISADGFYSSRHIDNNGYNIVSLSAGARFYFIGKGVEGMWAGVSGGAKFVDITRNGRSYNGVLSMLHIGLGYKIAFDNFFIEPYGGYSFAGGEISGVPEYGGGASLYGANMGFMF